MVLSDQCGHGQMACATGQWRARGWPPSAECYSYKLIRARGACSVRFRHVRAHTGEAGNEAADALAKAAVKDAMMCGASQDVRSTSRVEQAASARVWAMSSMASLQVGW